jgi:hypothetical protein
MEGKLIQIVEGTQGLLEKVLRVLFYLLHVEEVIAKFLFIDVIRGFVVKQGELLNMPDIALDGALRPAGEGEILDKTFS